MLIIYIFTLPNGKPIVHNNKYYIGVSEINQLCYYKDIETIINNPNIVTHIQTYSLKVTKAKNYKIPITANHGYSLELTCLTLTTTADSPVTIEVDYGSKIGYPTASLVFTTGGESNTNVYFTMNNQGWRSPALRGTTDYDYKWINNNPVYWFNVTYNYSDSFSANTSLQWITYYIA